MSTKQQRINWTEEQLDERLLISMHAHRASGFETVSAWLVGRAANFFSTKKDEMAIAIRQLSEEVKAMGEKERQQQRNLEKEYDSKYKGNDS